MKKKCPFSLFEDCREDCELYDEVTRSYDSGRLQGETFIMKGCSIKMMWLELANQTQRLSMLQKEAGETKSAAVLQSIAMVGTADQAIRASAEVQRMAKRKLKEIAKDAGSERREDSPRAEKKELRGRGGIQ